MGYFTNETGWREIADRMRITKSYAKQIKSLIDRLPAECAVCRKTTLHVFLMRPADAESERLFGPVSRSKNCKIAMQRLCRECQDSMGGTEGVFAHFKRQALSGNTVSLPPFAPEQAG